MRYIALFLIVLAGCGGLQVPQLGKVDPGIEAVAGKVELVIGYAEQGFESGRKAAEEICVAFPKTCDSIHVSETNVAKTLEIATQALADYRAGKASYNDLSAAVEMTIRSVNNFLSFVEATGKHTA